MAHSTRSSISDAERQSPSGLLTLTAWQCARARTGEPERDDAEDVCDRGFARWVQIEAKTLAGRLEELAQTGPGRARGSALGRHLRALTTALAADAAWARERIDGRFDGLEDGGGNPA